MYSQTIPITGEKQIELKVDGDLELRGWANSEVSVTVDRESDLQIQPNGEKITIESLSDLEISVPEGMEVSIRKVEGDADIEDLTALLILSAVGGDLDLNSVGEARIDSVGGDLDARKAASLTVTAVGGDCSVSRVSGEVQVANVGGDLDAEDLGALRLINVGGDCSAQNVAGEFTVANVGGDLSGNGLAAQVANVTVGGDLSLHVRQGGIKALAGGDLSIYFDGLNGEPVNLSAGGDASLHLPVQANAKIHITSGGQDIRMRVGGWNESVEMFTFDFSLGDGTTPITITAGGDVVVNDGSSQTHKGSIPFEFAGVKVDVDAISQTVQETVERATRQAERASREVEERIQAAMRRVEDQTRRRGFHMNFDPTPATPPIPTVPPAPPASTAPVTPPAAKVSDEERKLILQMLQDHKITAEEAIHLLDALEGKNL